jgi:Ca2+-binding EF-hand superfamily protein|tara:strand:+ start:311 stop:478 length:168 start_codon:yes stop_codon:yes gene_type:complete
MTEEEIFEGFLKAFGDKDGDGEISKDEWCDYYKGISSSFDTDDEFVQSITNAWKL